MYLLAASTIFLPSQILNTWVFPHVYNILSMLDRPYVAVHAKFWVEIQIGIKISLVIEDSPSCPH